MKNIIFMSLFVLTALFFTGCMSTGYVTGPSSHQRHYGIARPYIEYNYRAYPNTHRRYYSNDFGRYNSPRHGRYNSKRHGKYGYNGAVSRHGW